MRTRSKCYRMGLSIDKWGPGAWNTLHSFAHKAPERLSQREEEEWRTFLYLFAKRLPCPKCRKHFKEYLDANVAADTFATRASLARFVHEAHNDVSRRLDKPVWTYEDHVKVYSCDPSLGVPWRLDVVAVLTLVLLASALGARRLRKKSLA